MAACSLVASLYIFDKSLSHFDQTTSVPVEPHSSSHASCSWGSIGSCSISQVSVFSTCSRSQANFAKGASGEDLDMTVKRKQTELEAVFSPRPNLPRLARFSRTGAP